jgi:hypothetical protein
VGTGYWVKNKSDATTLKCWGYPVTSDFEITLPEHTKTPYWVMIGSPYQSPISYEKIRFQNKAVSDIYVSWETAYQNGFIDSKGFGYEPSAGGYFTVGPDIYYPDRNQMEPWRGYWLLITRPEELKVLFSKQ